MKASDHALNVLTAYSYTGVGKAWIVKHLLPHESTAGVVAQLRQNAKEKSFISFDDFQARKESIRSELGELKETADGVVAIGDHDFPTHRGVVKNSDRPIALFYRGDLSLLAHDNKNIAVIGLRTPNREIETMERLVVVGLVERGAAIISGLALGCDTIAHRQALQAGGKTVAILPSPLNDILPQANRGLADDIVRGGGLLISEYYDKAHSKNQLSGRYLERDRLQAMFSECVVLSASFAKSDLGLDSGSRHAMEYARIYSIRRAVMYDTKAHESIPEFSLNRQLMAEDTGIAVINRDDARDVLDRIMSTSQLSLDASPLQNDLFS